MFREESESFFAQDPEVYSEHNADVLIRRRKRVTISEAALAHAPLQCWDNSTRGLDSANAIEFCKNLRVSAEYMGTTAIVAIYQAPQSAYDVFDKVH